MSRHVGQRVWGRVVCVVSPGTGKHRIHTRLDELEAELARERAEKLMLLEKIRDVRSVERSEPQLAPPVVTSSVTPSPSTAIEETIKEEKTPETVVEKTQPINMAPVLKAITVRPLYDLTVIGHIPAQRNSIP